MVEDLENDVWKMSRPIQATVEELKNNRFAMEDWNQDAYTYCLCHCKVYKNVELYIAEVERGLSA